MELSLCRRKLIDFLTFFNKRNTSEQLLKHTRQIGYKYTFIMSSNLVLSMRGRFFKLSKGTTRNLQIRKSSSDSQALFNDDDLAKIKRQEEIMKHLSGRPFDYADDFKISLSLPLNRSIEKLNPQIATSPFVKFDGCTALQLILNKNPSKQEINRYDYFKRIQYDYVNESHDEIDYVVLWNKKYKKNLKPIEHTMGSLQLELNDTMKLMILEQLSQLNTFDFENMARILAENYPKMSYESIISNLMKIIPQLTSPQRRVFVDQAQLFFSANIIHFHDSILTDISTTLVEAGEKDLLVSIIQAYNKSTHSDFYNIVSLSFTEKYLDLLVEKGDISAAREVLIRIEKKGYYPSSQSLTNYIEGCMNVCMNVDAVTSKQEMLFNVLTESTMSMILLPGMINEKIIKSIAHFMRVNNLDLFIKYLQNSPDYEKFPEVTTAIVDRIKDSSTFSKKSDLDKAIFLTSMVDLLGFSRSQYSENCKKNIITVYAEAKAPLAVLSWSRLLTEPLSADEKKEILGLLGKGVPQSGVSPVDISSML